MRISFISKVTRVHKAATAANDTSLCSTILVVFLGFHPGRPGWNIPYEQTTKFVSATKPAWLPGSYEEALRLLLYSKRNRYSRRTSGEKFETNRPVKCTKILRDVRIFITPLRWYGTLKYGDVHEKFNFLEIQDLGPLRTGQKHFETILPNFLPDECEI